MKVFEMIPYRCHACSERFYAYRAGEKSDRLRTREEQKIMQLRRKLKWRKSKVELIAYGCGFLLFLVFLYMTIQHRVPTE